ncbi:MAG: autotransporter assembly complex protein TamA [Polymorphobacter sp.]
MQACDPNLKRHWRRLLAATALPLLATPALAEQSVGAPQLAPSATAVPATVEAPIPDLGPVDIDTGEPRIEDFAPLPGPLGDNVPWPTVESTTEGEAVVAAADVRYTVSITGLSALRLDDEFQSLSALWTKKGDVSNLAQINRRIAEDRDLIDQLLRSVGHYGGNTKVSVTAAATANGPTQVSLIVDPGPIYTFDSISVVAPDGATGAPPASLVTPLLGVRPGDPVDAARVNTAQDTLLTRLADAGYAFPVVGKPEIVIDHATRTASLLQSVDIGARGVHGIIHIEGETQGFDDEHVAILARFKPGAVYTDAGRDDLRRAMIQTGLFGSVGIKPTAGPVNADGTQTVNLVITTESAPVRTIATTVGYSTGQGIRGEASWTHRNLFKPEGGLTVRGVGAQREQVLIAELQRRNFRRRDQLLSARFGISAEQQNAFDASTIGAGLAIARESNIIWQKPWTYSVGAELLATRQRDRSAPNDPNNTYFILALPGNVTWDQSDDLLNPSRGFRLTARVSPEFTLRSGTNFNYVKTQLEATAYQPFGNVVLAGRLHFGAIAGANRGRIAPNRRFYAGGGGSVRGFDFQGVGPKDVDGSPTGGNSLTEAAFEVRYRLQAFGNDIGLVGFVDAGQDYASSLPKFDSLKIGAGIGLRYFTSFGPVRIDVATPVTRSPGDPKVAFYVSIGQAF